MEKKLLFSVSIKDCRVDTFTVGGHGGAGKDTANTGVRVTHEPSGGSGTGTRSRSQHANKVAAFESMVATPEFKTWHRRICAELTSGKAIEERVEEEMAPSKLKIECKNEKGRWVMWELGEDDSPDQWGCDF